MKLMMMVELWLTLLGGQPATEVPPPPPSECAAEDCSETDSASDKWLLRRLFPSINNGY